MALVDESGVVVASVRIGDDAAGLSQVVALLAEHDPVGGKLPVAIETSQDLLVAGSRAAGRKVFAINLLAVSRCRDRYRSLRGKSDAFDAMVLANILRTDAEAHRPLPQDSELLQSLRVLTRAQQDAAWDQVTLTNRIRAVLRLFFPAALAAFERGGRHRLDLPAARAVLTAASTPAAAAALTVDELALLLRAAGRQRGIAVAHPDAKIVTSVPGLGVQLGARLLAEIGDDRGRYADARALRAFAGAAPVTRASGKAASCMPVARRTTGSPLPDTCGRWLRCGTTRSGTLGIEPAAKPATGMSPRYVGCSTSCSASCITACNITPSTTRPEPSRTP